MLNDADTRAKDDSDNPLMDTISVHKWEPDEDMIRSIDETMMRQSVTRNADPDQWHKDYKYAKN